MTSFEIQVENIKCGGCEKSIQKALIAKQGIVDVTIQRDEQKIVVSGVGIDRTEIIEILDQLGYPEVGNNKLSSKAKSLVSCMIGNIS
jgi:copper chaperone CopZ